MLLKSLIKDFYKEKKKIIIRGLASDSKKIRKGYIFFAIKGNKFNGEKYINEAVKNGAVAIVCSQNCNFKNKNIPTIKTSNVRYLLSEVCSKFFKLKPKNIIAVTGTNGKTSVSDLFYQILDLNKIPVASIGTLGIKYKKKIFYTKLTSPDTITIHQTLEKIKKKNIENVIIEASSHGLHQHRIDHLDLKAGIFTNFSQDHLDYHKSMQSYLNAKMLLFKKILQKNKTIICNKDTKESALLKKISKKRKLRLLDIKKIYKKIEKTSNLKLHKFQKINLSMAVLAAKLCNVSEKKIFSTLKKIKEVNGRIELVKIFTNNIKVYIDYAHTPDALLKTLTALKNLQRENISLVFGCGGDRDFKKRPLMAKVASNNCKKIYVTDDNPRNEKPSKIRSDIFKNIKNKNSFNISNRANAIKKAILNADPNEIILIAGKGHEKEQIYKNKIISISDKQIIKKFKFKTKPYSKKNQNFLENKEIIRKINKNFNIKNFHGLAIDSRMVKKNNLFLTIKGKNNNGINFVDKALKKGARNIVSSQKIKKHKNKLIKVKDETNFLNNFASIKREKSNATIIAITGSAGKTSLKNLIFQLLKNFGDSYCSPKSYNNHFGVPLSLSNLKKNHKYGIFELGMSKRGEINSLSKIVKPHIGIITNIGEAHIENFKNLKGIANAKGELIDNINKDGVIILNRDDKYFSYFQKKARGRKLNIVSFGKNKRSDVYLIKNKKNKELDIKINRNILKLNINDINIYNVLSSLALLNVLNLNIKNIAEVYKYLKPTEGRGQTHLVKRYKKRFKLIDESYNANPLSVKNAIENFNLVNKQKFKKYLVLGDMLELGKKSDKLHKDLSTVINKSDIDKVFIKGEKTLTTYKNISRNKRGNIFQHDEDLDFTLNNIIANNDYLMIKGSNATGLNNLSKKIIKGY